MASIPIQTAMPSTSGGAATTQGFSTPSASGNIIMDLLNWGTNLGTNIWSMFNKKNVQDQNQKNWQDEFNYQKELNNTLMEREDNQYQRTVEDMRKAGLNPLSINGANTNSLQAMTGGNGNSNSAQLVSNNINPLGTMQDNYYKALNAHNNTVVATATAKDLESQARHRDVESQILESHIPENNFLRRMYESFSDEEVSRYADSFKRSMFDEKDKPGLENEALRQSNKSQKLQNQLMESTLQDKIYQSQLESIRINEEISKLKSGRAVDNSERRKNLAEETRLRTESKRIQAEIKTIQQQAELLGLEVFYKEQTQGELIKAINQNNKRSQSILWNLYGAGASTSISPYGISSSIKGTDISPKK